MVYYCAGKPVEVIDHAADRFKLNVAGVAVDPALPLPIKFDITNAVSIKHKH